uniref:FRIGIDA-like protein n=1 Tax=Oryza nivara TaxID=4536 RepID=A0A0E0GRW7_ORYNI
MATRRWRAPSHLRDGRSGGKGGGGDGVGDERGGEEWLRGAGAAATAAGDLHAPVPAAHVGSLERRLTARSEILRTKCHFLDVRTSRRLKALRCREVSIDGSMLGLSQFDSLTKSKAGTTGSADTARIAEGLKSLCASMDLTVFFTFMVARRKEVDALRAELPDALKHCVDPARFTMVDKQAVRCPTVP